MFSPSRIPNFFFLLLLLQDFLLHVFPTYSIKYFPKLQNKVLYIFLLYGWGILRTAPALKLSSYCAPYMWITSPVPLKNSTILLMGTFAITSSSTCVALKYKYLAIAMTCHSHSMWRAVSCFSARILHSGFSFNPIKTYQFYCSYSRKPTYKHLEITSLPEPLFSGKYVLFLIEY